MRVVVQRVNRAKVTVAGETVGQIGKGFLALVGAACGDTEGDMLYGVEKLAGLRVFEDNEGKMNRSILDIGGSILLVSQFTLLGDARGGRRPSFITAEAPEKADAMYQRLMAAWREKGLTVQHGVFGADMQVELVNDGPVTLLLDTDDWK